MMSNLKQTLFNKGYSADDLDSVVDDAASRLAARVNNEGISDQLRFLTDTVGLSDDDVLNALEVESE